MKYNVDVLNTALDRALVKLQNKLQESAVKRYVETEKYLRRNVQDDVRSLQESEQRLAEHLQTDPKIENVKTTEEYKTIRRWQKTLALTDEAIVSLPNTADTRELLSLLTGD